MLASPVFNVIAVAVTTYAGGKERTHQLGFAPAGDLPVPLRQARDLGASLIAEVEKGPLAVVQLAHGLTYGITQVGTMGLLVRHVPPHAMARAQGYFAACSGLVTSGASILSGAVYAQYGQGVYYVMAAMALSGAAVMWLARRRLQPHSTASGG